MEPIRVYMNLAGDWVVKIHGMTWVRVCYEAMARSIAFKVATDVGAHTSWSNHP